MNLGKTLKTKNVTEQVRCAGETESTDQMVQLGNRADANVVTYITGPVYIRRFTLTAPLHHGCKNENISHNCDEQENEQLSSTKDVKMKRCTFPARQFHTPQDSWMVSGSRTVV